MALQDEKLSIASLTGGEREGAGAFEELMRAVKSHLLTEYNAGRITGDNYTQAYISSLDVALGNASQYLLQHEIQNQQVRLLDEQIAAAKLQVTLTQAQIDRAAAELLHVQKQTLKLGSDINLVDAQVAVQAKTLLIQDEQIASAQKDLLVKDAQIALSDSNKLLTDQQTSNALTQNTQISTQTTKISAEKDILLQRVVSEEAQTKDVVDGQPVGGIIGKQMALYENQADGYIRDAEQKVAKLMNDSFVTRVTTDWDNPDASTAGLNDAEVAKVFTKLKAGINVT